MTLGFSGTVLALVRLHDLTGRPAENIGAGPLVHIKRFKFASAHANFLDETHAMTRSICSFAVLFTLLIPATPAADAQWFSSASNAASRYDRGDARGGRGHDDQIRQLHAHAKQLKIVAGYLHDDADSLSWGYRHRKAVKYYVTRIEQIHVHMHETLADVARHRFSHEVCLTRLRSDVRQVVSWVDRLERKLADQALSDLCRSDQELIRHLRLSIATEMRPLLVQFDQALVDHSLSKRFDSTLSSRPHFQPDHNRKISRRPSFSFFLGF